MTYLRGDHMRQHAVVESVWAYVAASGLAIGFLLIVVVASLVLGS